MLKNLINLVFLAPNFIASPILNSFQNTSSSLTPINYVDESILIENSPEDVGPISSKEDKYLWGPNSDTIYRIYIDNSGDNFLPKLKQETNDYIVGKGKKDHWFDHLINGLSINIFDFAQDKEAFLKKYKALTLSYFYSVNFWNSQKGWTYEQGKYESMWVDSLAFDITPNNIARTIFEKKDASHENNESAKLVMRQEWNGNLLTYNFYLSVSYHWKALSPIKHASLAQFSGDHYALTSIPEGENNKEIKIGKIQTDSKFALDYYPQEISFVDFDKEIKNQAQKFDLAKSRFKTGTVFVQSYRGVKRVDNTIYSLSIYLVWVNSINYDSTLLLNGYNLQRLITTDYIDCKLSFNYENLLGEKANLEIKIANSEMLGMEMVGTFHFPFIYLPE